MEVLAKKSSSDDAISSLNGFEVREVLADTREGKTMALLCSYRGRDAVVVVSPKDWSESSARSCVASGVTLGVDEQNAEYWQFSACVPLATKVSIVWPATAFHIDKWRPGKWVCVRETPLMYREATLKYVGSIPASRNAWVQNIFDGLKEADRVLFLDNNVETGFVVVPDLKMDMSNVVPESVYLQCIVRDSSLRSVRDLRASHLPLLTRIRDTVLRIGREKLNCKSSQLRMYFHYYPSFWWLHIHVVHTSFFVPGGGINIGKAILLEDVSQNLELKSDYYAEATLVTHVKLATPHYEAFKKANIDLDE